MRTEQIHKVIWMVSAAEFEEYVRHNQLDREFQYHDADDIFESFLDSQLSHSPSVLKDLEDNDILAIRDFSIEHPDNAVMAFNHNVLVITTNSASKLSHYEVELANEGGDTKKIKIVARRNVTIILDEIIRAIGFPNFNVHNSGSRLVEFYYVITAVPVKGDSFSLLASTTNLIHGFLKAGQRLHNIGATERKPYMRTIPVFTEYENKISIPVVEASQTKTYFHEYGGVEIASITDAFGQNNSITYPMIIDLTIGKHDFLGASRYVFRTLPVGATGPFSQEHSYQFQPPKPEDIMLFFVPVCKKDGIFLRWLDNANLWHSFLFEKGTEEEKQNRDSNVIEEMNWVHGIMQSMSRPITTEITNEIVCGAPCLNDERYEEVSSIATAQFVEMYSCGSYIPVKIETTSLKKNQNKVQNEVEIKIVSQENTMQL